MMNVETAFIIDFFYEFLFALKISCFFYYVFANIL